MYIPETIRLEHNLPERISLDSSGFESVVLRLDQIVASGFGAAEDLVARVEQLREQASPNEHYRALLAEAHHDLTASHGLTVVDGATEASRAEPFELDNKALCIRIDMALNPPKEEQP